MNKTKDPSALVQSVLALDTHFSELERLSARIADIELKSEFDFEQTRRLMNHFSDCGQSVSTEVVNLATQLNEARAKAEEAAKIVAERALQIQARRAEQDLKMEAFRNLAGRVNALGQEMGSLKKTEDEIISEDERAKLSMRLSELDLQLQPLIEEALQLKKQAQESKMKTLEQNTESLSQSLKAVRQKLSVFTQPQSAQESQ